MRNAIVILALLLFSVLRSQTLTGIVYDEKKLPLPGASVYLDGTSTGTITSEDGTFELTVPNRINTVLVFSFIGYEPEIVRGPFANKKYEVHLRPKTSMLQDVVILKGGFSRKEMLVVFREQFLGRTRAGRSCTILNEDDVNLRYDYKKNRILAASDVPLKIHNLYLGYDIDFNLVEFYVAFNQKSVRSTDISSSAYAGTTVFRLLPDLKNQFDERRRKAFNGSQVHFFKNLIDGIWGKEQFILYKGSYPTSPEEHFEVIYNDGLYAVKVISPVAKMTSLSIEQPKFYAPFNLLFNGRNQSGVIFRIENFNVDSYGNTNAALDIVFTGEMSRLRAGDMLPIDYSP